MLNIYYVHQSYNRGYDTYDGFICAASSENEARLMTPDDVYDSLDDCTHTWTNVLSEIKVDCIGVADPRYTEKQVILASFNAG